MDASKGRGPGPERMLLICILFEIEKSALNLFSVIKLGQIYVYREKMERIKKKNFVVWQNLI